MSLIDDFMAYTQSKFGFTPRKRQIKASYALAHKHKLVHMDTGEGKTVTTALAALLAVKAGRRVYIVTVNDYLAKRDYEMFREFFKSQNIVSELNIIDGDKQTIHAGDIIYTSVQNLLFDYVSNEFKSDGIHFDLDMAILDEIDYVLLDSANTRFSVSMGDGCIKQDTALLDAVWSFVQTIPDEDMEIELHKKRLTLNDKAYEIIEKAFNITPDDPQYKDVVSYCHTALVAKYCYINGMDYLVEPDSVLGVLNRYNGRSCRNSYFNHELDYFLRQKEKIRFASLAGSFTNSMSAPILFRKFKTVVGLSGTVKQAREELGVLVGGDVKIIRPSSRSRRIERRLRFKTKREKYIYIERFIKQHGSEYSYLIICEHECESNEVFEQLSTYLFTPVSLLTNQNIDSEQELIDCAGLPGNVLVSTHLVGRGTDIVTDAKQGLCVFVTHKGVDIRADVQVRGRTGRNGGAGLAITLTSKEDKHYDAGLETQRAISLCEDIILENAKLSLMEWAEGFENADEVKVACIPYWLDFRRSLTGRLMFCFNDGFPGAIYSACEIVKREVRVLICDIVLCIYTEGGEILEKSD